MRAASTQPQQGTFTVRPRILSAMYGPSTFVHIYAIAFALAAYGVSDPSRAYGIAGNRLFPGTLNFDDPAVADEFSITTDTIRHPDDAGDVIGHAVTTSLARLLTPEVSIGFDMGFIRHDWGSMRQPDATGSDAVLKPRLCEDDLNETLVAGSLIYGLPHTGAKRLGANTSATIAPDPYVDQGFNALPDAWSWLRPLAITAGVGVAVPTGKTSDNLNYDPTTRQFNSVNTVNITAVHWGFALEYSILYLADRFAPGVLSREKSLHQWTPLVEFAFDSPCGQRTHGAVSPETAYTKDTWQVAAELVLPAIHRSTRGIGATTQILFFLDDFLPLLFGKPILAR